MSNDEFSSGFSVGDYVVAHSDVTRGIIYQISEIQPPLTDEIIRQINETRPKSKKLPLAARYGFFRIKPVFSFLIKSYKKSTSQMCNSASDLTKIDLVDLCVKYNELGNFINHIKN